MPLRRLLLPALVVALLLLPAGAGAAPPVTVRGDRFVDASGQPVFVLGANYEGAADRAWRMWDDGLFDPALIAADFDRARSAELAVLRIFVRPALAADVRAGRWAKLDRVMDLADQRGLRLIVTFGDHPEHRLEELARIARAVAARYAGRATLFAYDLKNEPHFSDLALADYGRSGRPLLQQPALVAALGEVLPRGQVPAYRASARGRAEIPPRLSDDQAYAYANTVAAYRRFVADAQAWGQARGVPSTGYVRAPEARGWATLLGALDDALSAWIAPQLEAVRGADPGRLTTLAHTDAFLASLSANEQLDYRTFHRYPAVSSAGIRTSMALFDDVRQALPGKPLVLGEFGVSNASADEGTSAALEAEMVRAVRDHGGAGALKWMLNDFPNPDNPREAAFGMFRADGSPKPVVALFRDLAASLRPLPAPGPAPRELDYAVLGGRFFTQTNGHPPGADPSGYSVTDADGVPFWTWFRRYGGVPAVGYPVGRRFVLDGFLVQPMQKAVLQWRSRERQVWLLNTFDRLHEAGKDMWLAEARQIPPPTDASPDAGLAWEQVVARRLAMLDGNAAVRARFLAEPDWLARFGLPVAVADYPGVYVVRAQRTTLQQWKSDVPWARAGEVTVANGGDLAKEAGLFPPAALVPEPPP